MTITTSGNQAGATGQHPSQPGLLSEIRVFWRQFFVAAFDPYRPELHYMRGPGPACRAKNQSVAPSKTNVSSTSH